MARSTAGEFGDVLFVAAAGVAAVIAGIIMEIAATIGSLVDSLRNR